jgi:PPOX class probable F420-dependent enzyme
MSNSLPDDAKALLDSNVFVTLATINDDGSPQLTVNWVKHDGDEVLISTIRGRRKERNLRRDPRVSVLAVNPDNPHNYLEVRGTVTVTEEGGAELIDELSEKYDGVRPYPLRATQPPRVVVRLTPEHVVWRMTRPSPGIAPEPA